MRRQWAGLGHGCFGESRDLAAGPRFASEGCHDRGDTEATRCLLAVRLGSIGHRDCGRRTPWIAWNAGDWIRQGEFLFAAGVVWLAGGFAVLLAVFMATRTRPTGRGWRPALGAAAVMATLLILGRVMPQPYEESTHLSAQEPAGRMHEVAARPDSDRVYFLGTEFERWPLTDIEIGADSVTFAYGPAALLVGAIALPVQPPSWSPLGLSKGGGLTPRNARDSRRFTDSPPCTGNSGTSGAYALGTAADLSLFTNDPLTMIEVGAGDDADLRRAAAVLRAVGGSSSSTAFALPSASDLAAIDAGCTAKLDVTGAPVQ
jgi:hypothetical protein